MQLSSLKPASQCAQLLGVKCVLYGNPGVGKTPLVETAPNVVLLAIEPGLLSMRNSNVPTYAAYQNPKGTVAGIEEFFKWWFGSNESSRFETLAIDSVSELAEVILKQEIGRNTNKLRAYGEMSGRVLQYLTDLYFQQKKHVVMIAKQFTDSETKEKRPSFPGNDLNVKVPHLFDLIMHYAVMMPGQIPGVMQEVKALRTSQSAGILARDRSGRLNEFEQPNLTSIFNKCMS